MFLTDGMKPGGSGQDIGWNLDIFHLQVSCSEQKKNEAFKNESL